MNSVTNNLPMNFSYLDSPVYRLRARQRIIALSVCRHLAVDLRSPSRLDSRSWLRSPAPRLTLPNEERPRLTPVLRLTRGLVDVPLEWRHSTCAQIHQQST